LILSCAEDLAEIDEKIRRHFQEDIEKWKLKPPSLFPSLLSAHFYVLAAF
jgi:hypothetical protein